jgi:cyclophilin family peptidyl-prolyl cis-trans isomerase
VRGTVGLARYPDELYRQTRAAFAAAYGTGSEAELDSKLRAAWPSAYALRERRESLESGKSQFFICTRESPHFTGRYSAFAKVVLGLEVVDAIEAGEVYGTRAPAPGLEERPVAPVRLRSVKIVRPDRSAAAASKPTPNR